MSIKILNMTKVHEAGIDLNRESYSDKCAACLDVTYEGAVLDMTERNGYDDSDFYAVVWDEAEGRVKSIQYATTRGWTYCNGASIDATPEVQEKAAAWYRAELIAREERNIRAELAAPHVGALVRVIRGRKVPKGFEGRVLSLAKVVNPYTPAPRFKGGWDTREMVATISNDTNTRTVKAEYLEVVPNPEYVEFEAARRLAEFKTKIERHTTNGRSTAYNTGCAC